MSKSRPRPVVGQKLVAACNNRYPLEPTIMEMTVTAVGRKYATGRIEGQQKEVRFLIGNWVVTEGPSSSLYASRKEYEDEIELNEKYNDIHTYFKTWRRNALSGDAIREIHALITGHPSSAEIVRLARTAMDLRRYGDPTGRLGRVYDQLTEELDRVFDPKVEHTTHEQEATSRKGSP